MNKISGKISDFSYITEDASRIIIGYGLTQIGESDMYEWYEVYLYKKQKSSLSFQDVKDAILGDIDSQTEQKIIEECPWTVLHGDDAGKQVTLWLNAENQRNYSEGQRIAAMTNGQNLPIKYKVGQNEDHSAVYDIFETVEEITNFYIVGAGFINQCLNEGWQRKDAIDWEPYEALFPQPDELQNEES